MVVLAVLFLSSAGSSRFVTACFSFFTAAFGGRFFLPPFFCSAFAELFI
jgi:hypothetical protein